VRKAVFSFCPAIALAVTTFVLVLFAFSGARAGAQTDSTIQDSYYSEITKAPAKVSAKQNSFENDPEAPRAGRKLYEQHCAECHGPSGREKRKAPGLFVEQVRQAPPGALFWVITNGVVRRGMPVWSKLPEAQRWQIVTYLKSAPKVEAQ